MKAKVRVGLHFMGRSHGIWGIWCYNYVNEETGASSAHKVTEVCTYTEAVETMYQLNGWGTPKYITRKF